MLFEIFRFEWWYRSRRPATYIYFAIMFLMGFAAFAWDDLQVGGGTGQVKDNAPTVIAQMMVILTAIPGFFISSAIMGVPVLRDFEHNTASMIFTTPLKKSDYLIGRFLGSFVVLILVFSGLLFGMMLGSLAPWLEAERMLPFQAWHFLQPFLLFALPNLLFTGALFFMGGTLSKNLLMVFVQGSGLLVLYIITGQLTRGLENRELAGIIDPIGISLQGLFSRYWSPAQQNTWLYPLEGTILINRLLWLGVGVASLIATMVAFRTSVGGGSGKPKARRMENAIEQILPLAALPMVTLHRGPGTNLRRLWALSRLYFFEIIRAVPFLAIVAFGMVMLIIGSTDFESMYGTATYPNTYLILQEIGGFTLFFIIIIVFYGGELIWRERDVRINLIYDALPMPDSVGLLAKFFGMMMVHVCLLLLLMITGMFIQTAYGYFEYKLPVYLSSLFGETLVFLALFSVLSLFVQVMVNQKFLGHAVMVLFFLGTLIMQEVGLEHGMFTFASGSLGPISDMNGFGHYVPRFSWYQVYWSGFAVLLFALGVAFSVRGTDTLLKTRAFLARQRFLRPLLIATGAGLVLFVGTGANIYYNTVVLNEFQSSDAGEEQQADYEKTLKIFADLPQLRIVETSLQVDIFPYDRDVKTRGTYILKNKTKAPVSDLHLQATQFPAGLSTRYLEMTLLDSLGGTAKLKEEWSRFGYQIYTLDHPIAPGDSMKLDFEVDFITKGFVEQGTNTDVVYNGTFFNNSYFPSLGYNSDYELGDDDTRREYDLSPKERMRERDDSIGLKINLVGDDADLIRFNIQLSTAEDQIAIAPGYLQKSWKENGRAYFHYQMDQPMFNFYAMVSARYDVLQEKWVAPYGDTVNLEIYYHPGHDYNIGRMMEAMKHSLRYYSEHFSPYQHRQMRILEFPRYASFAQSFANTVPFSESIGFVLDIGPDNVDIPYYVTAHEMAHQWWGHQVSEAQVKGNAFLSETMSQYSALMVMKEKYPLEQMQEFLRYELDSYLSGRALETKKEQPLELVEGQGYIHYRKGSLAMYAFQDYIGEDKVNAALKQWVQDWAGREDRYPTSQDLLGYFRQVTPDSMKYLIEDLFQTITLFENKTTKAEASDLGEGRYEVTLLLDAQKIRADSAGNELVIPLRDWIDIGVYGQSSAGKDSLLFLKKYQIQEGQNEIRVEVGAMPTKAGIDPLNILIDRNPGDNVMTVEVVEDGENGL